jgi:nicotinamide-nucleotide amidase
VAGPGGGTPAKPVGSVWIGVDVAGRTRTHHGLYIGDRAEIRYRAAQMALELVRRALDE